MNLPSPDEINKKEYFEEYFICTPTFDLTPIEKPDMSPFLIHMTGKNEILSILKGDKECDSHKGCLLASVPEYKGGNFNFDAKVVCFTESPTFALDFFRYRKEERWKKDQRYGIGFSKSRLVKKGVRPVIYLEDQFIKEVISLYHDTRDRISSLEKRRLNHALQEKLEELDCLNSILSEIYPLLFPLGDTNKRFQGFMWEREWRYCASANFVFAHADIEIICCPAEEEPRIRQVLGNEADQIEFIRSWEHYNDVTRYLRRQRSIWKEQNSQAAHQSQQSLRKRQLQELLHEKQKTLRGLQSHINFIKRLKDDLEKAIGTEEQLREEVRDLKVKLEKMEQRERQQHERRR